MGGKGPNTQTDIKQKMFSVIETILWEINWQSEFKNIQNIDIYIFRLPTAQKPIYFVLQSKYCQNFYTYDDGLKERMDIIRSN